METTTPTVGSYLDDWAGREGARGVLTAADSAGFFRRHLPGEMLQLPLIALDPPRTRAAIRGLRSSGLAHYTIRRVASDLTRALRDAHLDGWVEPVVGPRRHGDLPPARPREADFRRLHYFDHIEAEMLMTSPLVPERRRWRYTGAVLTGARIGELASARFLDWDRDLEPLGALVLGRSWDPKRREFRRTKTGAVKMKSPLPLKEWGT